jgi:hypothetical protein
MRKLRGESQKLLNDIGIEKLKEIYNEEGTLTNATNKLGICLETLRKYFKVHNIDYNKQVVYDVDHQFFSRENEASMYWAGFCGADINIAKDKPRLSLGLATKDKKHLIKFKNYVKTTAPIVDSIRIDERPSFKSKIYYISKIRFTSQQMVNDLRKFNIVPAKTYTYTIPDWIEEHPLCHHFLRGLIDGDGWIRDREAVGLCGTKECVWKAIEILSKKCGINIEDFNFNSKKPTVWQFNIVIKPLRKKLVEYLFRDATIYLDRKYECAKSIIENGDYIDRKHHLDFTNIDINDTRENLSKLLNTSPATVQRRLDDYGLRKIEHRYIYNNCFNISKPNEEQFYWLGFMFGHSSFNEDKYGIYINFRMKEVLEKLQNFIQYKNSNILETKTSFHLPMSSKELYYDLVSCGIKDKTNIPNEIINNINLNHFMRGFVDAKSSCAAGRLVISTITSNDNTIRKILTDKIGIDIQSKNRLALRKYNIIKLREFLYKDATIFIEEKKEKLLNI